MNQKKEDLSFMRDITKHLIKSAVEADEHALAEYIRNVCNQLDSAGEDLKKYQLVRTVDSRDVRDMKVTYSVEKKL